MFDFSQRGEPRSHTYRGFYDAGDGSTTHCSQCNRVIRYCYSLHDCNMKSFVIGTCCFQTYEGKTLLQLQAATVLQSATKAAVIRDTKLYGALTTIKDRRKQWVAAKRDATKLLRDYRDQHRYSGWLPKELFDLRSRSRRMPPSYRKPTNTLRWYEDQTRALVEETTIAAHALITKPCI